MRFLRVIFVATFLISVISTVCGAKRDKPTLPPHAIKMSAKIDMKNEYRMYDSAVAKLEEGVKFYSDDAEMHFLLGKAYSYTKDYHNMAVQLAVAESIQTTEGKKEPKWMKELYQIKEEKWAEIFNQGVKSHNEQKVDESLDLFLTSTILNPQDYRGFLRVGYAYALKGDNPSAIDNMKQGLKLAPDSLDMLRGYADVLFFSGRGEDALESYKKILEHTPQDVVVLKNVATIYSMAKDYDQALTYLEKTVEIDPEYKDGLFNIGEIYRQRINQILDALDSLRDESREYLTDEKSAPKIEQLLQKKTDLLSSSQAAYEKVMEIDTTDIEAMDRLAQIYQEQENFDRALELLKILVQKDCGNCKAWQQLAFIYAKRDMGNQAKEAYQKAQECVEGDK